MFTINREFARRNDDKAIGNVKLEAPKGEYKLDGEVLPDVSVEYLLTFALQSLQDAYAGQKAFDDAQAAFETKRTRLIEGTIGVRSGGTGATERDRVAIQVVRAWIKTAESASAEKLRKEYADAEDQSARDAICARVWEKNEETFAPFVDKELEERKAEAERKRALADAIDI